MQPRKLLTFTLLGIGVFVLALAAFSASGYPGAPASASPATTAGEFEFRRAKTLIGATDADIARFAQQFAEGVFSAPTGTTQVLINHRVTPEDVNALGLGPFGNDRVAKRPLALVVLKGKFDLRLMPGIGREYFNEPVSYVACVFDLQVADLTYLTSSKNGGNFRKALNDPTLPDDGLHVMVPTQQPTSSLPTEIPTTVPTQQPPLSLPDAEQTRINQ